MKFKDILCNQKTENEKERWKKSFKELIDWQSVVCDRIKNKFEVDYKMKTILNKVICI